MATTTVALSDYEQLRAANIERNNARLRALGLISNLEQKRSNATAWGVPDNNNDNNTKKKRKKTNPSSQQQQQQQQPARKSRRLQGEHVKHGQQENIDNYDNPSAPRTTVIAAAASFKTEEEREARVTECREARQRAALEVAKAGGGAKNPTTATYEHCLMRVKTMTEGALSNRVKAIERAAGKHCVVKMALFKSCLQDEGLWDIATLASEALERLKALLPPPDA